MPRGSPQQGRESTAIEDVDMHVVPTGPGRRPSPVFRPVIGSGQVEAVAPSVEATAPAFIRRMPMATDRSSPARVSRSVCSSPFR